MPGPSLSLCLRVSSCVPSLQVLDIPSGGGGAGPAEQYKHQAAHLQVQKTLINQLQLLVPASARSPQVVELIYMVMRQSHRSPESRREERDNTENRNISRDLTWPGLT